VKIINPFFAVIFLISAGLQFNDPDPALWIAIYGYGALACALAFAEKDNRIWHLGGLIVFLVYAAYLFFVTNGVLSWITQHKAESITGPMAHEKPWIELTREFFGLLILCFAHLLNLLFRFKKNSRTQITEHEI